ncbi:MAG: hypothetical protein ACRDYD_14455 [Acidimicrobiales bacterium]
MGVYDEHLNLGGGELVAEILGLTVAILGVYLVASSPVVTGRPRQREPAIADGRAAPIDDTAASRGEIRRTE